MSALAPAAERGLLVLGMHRSGTSAVTRAINLLGVPLAADDALLPADEENPDGYWEPTVVIAINERLLSAVGGSWLYLPELEPGWWNRPGLSALAGAARELFREIHPTPAWACKDPRLTLTLPFWLAALGVDPALVVCYRHPLEVARSLERRNGLSKAAALASWEQYAREALRHAAGRPALVTRFDDLLDDPMGWSERMGAFLAATGLIDPAAQRRPAGNAEPALRHHRVRDDELERDPDVTPAQRELYARLEELRGAHAAVA